MFTFGTQMFQLKVCHIEIKYLEIEILLLLCSPAPSCQVANLVNDKSVGVLAACSVVGELQGRAMTLHLHPPPPPPDNCVQTHGPVSVCNCAPRLS